MTFLINRLFPEGNATDRSGDEINGLPAGSVPQNCEIISQAQEVSLTKPQDRRVHYLVRSEGHLVDLRVCSAMEGSGYDEFAVILHVAVAPEDQKELESSVRQRHAMFEERAASRQRNLQ